MHLYSTPLNITRAPTAYEVLGCQLGIVCAEAAARIRTRISAKAVTSAKELRFMKSLLSRFNLAKDV
jgi:hypothetical protein